MDLFNAYFASVFLPKADANYPVSINNMQISDFQITTEEVENCLGNLDCSKSPGPDGIHPRLLKECRTEIASTLSSLFNKSLSTIVRYPVNGKRKI